MKKLIKLPIDSFMEEITHTVENNAITIIVAETGAGKSTRVPMMIMDHLQCAVITTQPRRIAAESLAIHAAHERGLMPGKTIGFRTAQNKKDGRNTTCLYCTDGLQLVKELTNAKKTSANGAVLIIDETHEFNENIETLLAWSRKLIDDHEDVKIVIMSATLPDKELSDFFYGAPVIKVPGRTFPVYGAPIQGGSPKQVPETEMLSEIKRFTQDGENTLVFLPGKAEIIDMKILIDNEGLNAEILLLHADLSPAEQKKVFREYSKPKIILSTNVAQTSITIPDVTAVVDSGLEKKVELQSGFETLVLNCVSKADVHQRAGRAGRVQEGYYVLCCNKSYKNFRDYPEPEIMRKNLDQLVLRLANAGFDAADLKFFHQPDVKTIKAAKSLLIDMKALLPNGEITALGQKINRFPTSVPIGRMIMESIDRGCLSKVLDIAAILTNSRSSIKLKQNKYSEYPDEYKFWNEVLPQNKKYNSDLFIELYFWNIGHESHGNWGEHGVDENLYLESIHIRKSLEHVVQSLGCKDIDLYSTQSDNEDVVLKCILAGMIGCVYGKGDNNWYHGVDRRKISKGSHFKQGNAPSIMVASPKNIATSKKSTLRVLEQCSAVKTEWLHEVAPHLFKIKRGSVSWCYRRSELVSDAIVYFKGREILRETQTSLWNDDNAYFFSEFIATVTLPNNDSFSKWINELRSRFMGENSEFAKKFYQAILPYETTNLSRLMRFSGDIAQKILQ